MFREHIPVPNTAQESGVGLWTVSGGIATALRYMMMVISCEFSYVCDSRDILTRGSRSRNRGDWCDPCHASILPGQCFLNASMDAIMDLPGFPETDFVFCRMHIHVSQGRIHLQVQHIYWIASRGYLFRVGYANGMVKFPVPDDAIVVIEILAVHLASMHGFITDPAP